MSYVKLVISQYGSYNYKGSSDIPMDIIGNFLTSDVGCSSSGFKEWILDDKLGDACSGNIVALEKDGNYIELTDLYSQEEIPTVLRVTRKQIVKLLDDWEEKVCKQKPQEVIIKYDNDEFIFETKN